MEVRRVEQDVNRWRDCESGLERRQWGPSNANLFLGPTSSTQDNSDLYQ